MRTSRTTRLPSQGRWQLAIRALARAQATFNAVDADCDASEVAFRRAWLGLWRAERYQLALLRREQHG